MARTSIPATRKEWFDLALFYCSKRETSQKKLRLYLIRKMKFFKPDEDATASAMESIENVLAELVRLKVVDDERYAGMLSRDYARRGKGTRYVVSQFYQKGLGEQIDKIEVNAETEFENAVVLAAKTLQRSNIKKLSDKWEIRTKVMQKLIASGFSISDAKRAIDQALAEAQNGKND